MVNIVAANQTAPVSIAYVPGLLLNMEMQLLRHRSSTSLSSDQTSPARFTPKSGTSAHVGRGNGRSTPRGRGRDRDNNGGCSTHNSNRNGSRSSSGSSSTH